MAISRKMLMEPETTIDFQRRFLKEINQVEDAKDKVKIQEK